MKFTRFLALIVLVTGIEFLVLQILPPLAARQDMSTQEKKMMDQMMKYGTPGPEHELLKKYAGDWDVEIISYPPAGQPQKSMGAMKGALIFDGRYVKMSFEGLMGDMKFQGLEVVGYDLFKKMYTTFWIDSWNTAFTMTSGSLDKSGLVLTETGMFPDAMTDGKTMQKVKNITTFMGDGKIKFEMFMVMPDGQDVKGMELTYTRKR